MSFQMISARFFALGSLWLSVALGNFSAFAGPCDELDLVVATDTIATRALEKAQLLPASPLRARILRELEAERTQIEAALDRLGRSQSINTGEVSRLQSRLHAWEEVAEGPPVRLVPSTHHDPSHPNFRGGGSRTTPMPPDAESAFARAIPEEGTRGYTWWVKVGRDFYRYQGSEVGGEIQLHWNGITAGPRAISISDVPNAIRRSFE